MGCSCNFFGRVISVTSPKSHEGAVDGRSSKSKKKRKKGRRGGPMDDDDVEEGNVEYRCLPHPERPPVYNAQSMARSVIYSNDSPIVVMHAPATDYSHAPPTTSYAYAAPARAAVVLEQQAPTPSKSRVRFSLPDGGGRQQKDEPVVAMPVGVPLAADTYYQHPQHDHHLQVVQQHSSSSHNQQLLIRPADPAVTATPAGCGAYHTPPPPPHIMHPAAVPPEYNSNSYPTPMREAVYRIGTDTNRFSMFSDENPNACAIV